MELTQRSWGGDCATVIRMLADERVGRDDPRFVNVTDVAYSAARGTISRDVFDADGGGYVNDNALLGRLPVEELANEVPALLVVY